MLNKVDMNKAEGAIVIIYYKNLFLMGQETNYLTDDIKIQEDFKAAHSTSLNEAFLFPGETNNSEDLLRAKDHFSQLCKMLENTYLTKITYADIKDSRKSPGQISAKPRYVKSDRSTLYGFPKGSYELTDKDLVNTILRECYEETGIALNRDKLLDTKQTAPTGRKGNYVVFHYKLTKSEYNAFQAVIKIKNANSENELQNLQFLEIPQIDPRLFFTNVASKEAYERTFVSSNRPNKTRKAKKLKNENNSNTR